MKKSLLLFIFTYLLFQFIQAQKIYTYAGGGVGDGNLATKASLGAVVNLMFDNDKNLVFSDIVNKRVRKINISTGIISTLAGNGGYGNSGNGGKADTARCDEPSGLAIDKAGNIYFATINIVRKIDRITGLISTIAGNGSNAYGGNGGPALLAGFNKIIDVEIDPFGDLYISTSGDNRIRKVNLTTGIVSAYAGTGNYGYSGNNGLATSADLSDPKGMYFDSIGNLYFGSSYHIRKIIKNNGIITTVVGNGNFDYNGENLDPTSAGIGNSSYITADTLGNFYFTDGNSRIRIWNTINNKVKTFVGTSSYAFNGDGLLANLTNLNVPSSVLSDKSGTVYLSDYRRIRKVDPITKIVSTIGGKGTLNYLENGILATQAGFDAPIGLAKDLQGNLYISDSARHQIRKVNKSTGIISIFAGTGTPKDSGDNGLAINAGIYIPMGITFDSVGALYIASIGCNCIKRIDPITNIITTIAGNKTSGYSGDNGPATAAKLNVPFDVDFDKSGFLYIADAYNGLVRKVNRTTGIISKFAGVTPGATNGDNGLAINATMGYPVALEFDSVGNLFIVDKGNSNVRKVDLSGKINTLITISGRFLTGIAIDRQGFYYLSVSDDHKVIRVDAKTGVQIIYAGDNKDYGYNGDNILAANAALNIPTGLLVDKNNRLFIAEIGSQRIRNIDIVNFIPNTGINFMVDELERTLIYPNPSNGHLTIQVGKSKGFNTLEIYDLKGCMQKRINLINNIDQFFELDNGIYLIKLSGETDFETNKVIVNH